MKNNKNNVLKEKINTIDEYNKFINRCESDDYHKALLEQFLLDKQYPKAITYNEAIEKFRKDLPVEITFNKNNTFNNNRVIVKKL